MLSPDAFSKPEPPYCSPRDAWETPAFWVLLFELPGLKASDLSVRVAPQKLIVSAVGFERQLALPPGTDRSGLRAHFTDGLLEILLPKTSVHPVAVTVTFGDSTERPAADPDDDWDCDFD
jgi:HSP20 family molecular chaperone IbpA